MPIFIFLMAIPIPICYLARYLVSDILNDFDLLSLAYFAAELVLVPIWYAVIGSWFATREDIPVVVVILFSFVINPIAMGEWDDFIALLFKGDLSESTWALLITNGIMLVFYLVLLPVGFIKRTEDEWVRMVEKSEKTGVKIGMTFEEWKASKRRGI